MTDGIGAGLAYLAVPEILVVLLIGVAVTSVVAAVPGLGGTFTLSIVFPFALSLDLVPALALLIAVTASDSTSNTITGVLFGVPGSGSGVATVFDGYPMTKNGEPRRALGAGFMSSFVGAVLGAVAMVLVLPVALVVIKQLGPPEFFALICLGLVVIAFVQDGPRVKSLMAGGLGLLLSFIGTEATVGQQRLTIGSVYLRDGLPLIPIVIGLFALSQMIDLGRGTGTMVPAERSAGSEKDSMRRGFKDVFVYWRTTLQSSWIGMFIGLLPGLGAASAQFAAYAAAARTAKTRDRFGQGSVEGVIAADACGNSKDGGGFIPTLAFGIPGSTQMALLLAFFIRFGIAPGPNLLETRNDLVWLIVGLLVVCNGVAVLFSIGLAQLIVPIMRVRARNYVPALTALTLWGAYTENHHPADILVALVFGVVGFLFIKYEYSRATLIIGFILGPLLERFLLLARQLYAFPFFGRPLTVGIYVMIIVVVVQQLRKGSRADKESRP